ncbi:MAG TPA: hypothetical protein PLJ78_07875 [Anaerolineae bacterium]|nr:hypothetical protein [Anaerolineae bacterium]HQK13843.1 hypothetical protein [Anaerolineae bacterium]
MTEIEEKLPADLLKEIYVNGIDGTTGNYSLPPLPSAAWAAVIKGTAPPENLTDLKHKQGPARAYPLPPEVQDSKDLAKTGWAVVFPAEMEEKRREAIKEALSPLLKRRQEQAGDLYKVFEGEFGYRMQGEKGRPESTREFYKRQVPEIRPGMGVAHLRQMPFYVLLVGSPEEITFEFQYQLDVMRGVGRLDFGNELEAYARYAQNVVAAETGAVQLPRQAAFFSVRNPGDNATLISDRYLVRPLFNQLQQPDPDAPLKFDWRFTLAASGVRTELERLLSGGERTPALLFTASHGMVFPPDEWQRQLREQGALLCEPWARGMPLRREDYFAAEDLGNVNLLGLVAFFFACFGAGTPKFDYFDHPLSRTRNQIAPYGFTSALPKQMLRRGALAVLGHVDRAWGHSFISAGSNIAIEAFVTALRHLLNGDPVGFATDPGFNLKYADMAVVLSDNLKELQRDPTYLDDQELVQLWTANNDARSYVVLGDPAVCIPFAPTEEAVVTRAAEPAALPPVIVDRLTTLQADLAPEPGIAHAAETVATPGGDTRVDEAHKALVNQDFAIQYNEIVESLKQFASRIAGAIEQITQDILTLEVRTYTRDDLRGIAVNNPEDAELRAVTFVDFDGDIRNYVPTTTEGVDEELWQIHRDMVREAQLNRTQFVSALAKMAGDLLDTFKVK